MHLWSKIFFAKLKRKDKPEFINYRGYKKENLRLRLIFEKEVVKKSEKLVKRRVKTPLFVGDIMLDRGVENN